MFYKAELDYMLKVLKKMNIRVLRLSEGEPQRQYLDFGLRKFLGIDVDYGRMMQPLLRRIKSNTIYKITDPFLCSYILLMLPASPTSDLLLVGPYLTSEKTREQLMEEAERYNVPAGRFRQLEACYAGISVLKDEKPLLTLLNVFGETLWGTGSSFAIVEVDQQLTGESAVPQHEDEKDFETVMLHRKAMEERYAYENQLMDTISQGMTHRAELMLSGLSKLTLEQRTKDSVRNIKNYCIVSNTLMRKAAEKGGIHPVHLDSTSSMLARKVETVTSFDEGTALMREMVRTYCQLVRQHSNRNYSPMVQKVMDAIDFDLTRDLSLRSLAAMQNVNASYLSTLFHRETGKTVTEYVTEARMNNAARLFSTTYLQIQTVAQHCGIADVNYFSKVFKRHFGVTPKQFREDHQPLRIKKG